MAEIQRDMFPPNMTQRIQTPIRRNTAVSNISTSKERPWGNIIYPEPQQKSGTNNG